MRDWIIGASALLSAGSAKGEVEPRWLIFPLPEGAELRYLPVVVTLKDYPQQARRSGEEGTTLLSLQIDTSGRLRGCTTAQSSGSPLLDEQACRLYRERGRFELRGTSEPVTVHAPVKWVLVD